MAFLVDANSTVTSLMCTSEHGSLAVLCHPGLLASPASYAPTCMLLPSTSPGALDELEVYETSLENAESSGNPSGRAIRMPMTERTECGERPITAVPPSAVTIGRYRFSALGDVPGLQTKKPARRCDELERPHRSQLGQRRHQLAAVAHR